MYQIIIMPHIFGVLHQRENTICVRVYSTDLALLTEYGVMHRRVSKIHRYGVCAELNVAMHRNMYTIYICIWCYAQKCGTIQRYRIIDRSVLTIHR